MRGVDHLREPRKGWGISVYTTAIFAVVAGLFAVSWPSLRPRSRTATEATSDGMGLNPLLQDPLQIIHPLTLYAGYVLYTVPFAIVTGAMINGAPPRSLAPGLLTAGT